MVGGTESGTVCGKMNRHPGAWETQEQLVLPSTHGLPEDQLP